MSRANGFMPATKFRRDRGVVIGQVAADQLGDQLRLGGREELAADRGGARQVGFERRMGLDDGADRGGRHFRASASISASVAASEAIV